MKLIYLGGGGGGEAYLTCFCVILFNCVCFCVGYFSVWEYLPVQVYKFGKASPSIQEYIL